MGSDGGATRPASLDEKSLDRALDRPTKSYIGALLCSGAVAGVVTQAALDQFLDLGAVGVGSLASSAAVVVGLVTLALLLVYDHERQQYETRRR